MQYSSTMTPLLRRPENYVINHRKSSLQLNIVKSLCIVIVVMGVTTFLLRLGSNPEPKAEPIIPTTTDTSSPKPGVLLQLSPENSQDNAIEEKNIVQIEGEPLSYKQLDLTELTNATAIEELHLKFVEFDPQAFSQLLSSNKNFQSLKVIKMERVKIAEGKPWNFYRALLPMLEEYIIDLDIGFHVHYTDYSKQITEEHMLNILFYDKDAITSTSDLGEKIASDQVEITLRYDGWTVLSINKNAIDKGSTWEVVLGVEFANKVLLTLNQKKNMEICHLSTTECLLSLNAFPKSLQYLNLYRVNITDGDISDYFKSLEESTTTPMQMTELYIEFYNATLKLSVLPKSVKTLAIGDVVDAKYEVGDTVEAETVGLGFPLDVAIIDNFDKIFVNMKNVAVFEPTDGIQHLLLKRVLNTNVTWVLMEGFERRVGNSSRNEVEQEMEHLLENCGVPPTERNFLLFKDMRTLSWYEMDLDKSQKLKFRYDILGWNEFIDWGMYSKNFQ